MVRLARSYGALLVAEYVETPDMLRHARDLGFTLFQGNLLERAGVLDRAGARRVSLCHAPSRVTTGCSGRVNGVIDTGRQRSHHRV